MSSVNQLNPQTNLYYEVGLMVCKQYCLVVSLVVPVVDAGSDVGRVEHEEDQSLQIYY